MKDHQRLALTCKSLRSCSCWNHPVVKWNKTITLGPNTSRDDLVRLTMIAAPTGIFFNTCRNLNTEEDEEVMGVDFFHGLL